MSGNDLAFDAVIAAWIAFAVAFAVRKRAVAAPSRRRAPAAILGIALQAGAVAIIWNVRRVPLGAPILPALPTVNAVIAAAAAILAWASVVLMLWAIRTLGRQWAVAARLVDGHELITTGPYAIVRNPVYLGFFGLSVATGVVATVPLALPLAIAMFVIGTIVRVRAEEQLLRSEFGAAFDRYAERVPALMPRLVR
jgi:protein-S-isoprenylcysteine O-methyltransferase Ste14